MFKTDEMSSSTSCQWVTKLISETKVLFSTGYETVFCYTVTKTSFHMIFTIKENRKGLLLVYFNEYPRIDFFHRQDNTLLINIDWDLTAGAQIRLHY